MKLEKKLKEQMNKTNKTKNHLIPFFLFRSSSTGEDGTLSINLMP